MIQERGKRLVPKLDSATQPLSNSKIWRTRHHYDTERRCSGGDASIDFSPYFADVNHSVDSHVSPDETAKRLRSFPRSSPNCTSFGSMLSSCVSKLSRCVSLASCRSSGPVKKLKTAESGLKKRLVQCYTTDTLPPKGPIGDIDAVMNKFGLEQKSIVEQSEVAVSYCRCWLSSTFPRCDGSHKVHNMATGTL